MVSRRKSKITLEIAKMSIMRNNKKPGDKGKTKSTVTLKTSTPEPARTSVQASPPEGDGTLPSTSTEQQPKSPPVRGDLAGKSSSFDHWINELTEFEETKITLKVGSSQVSIEDALMKLEAKRDIPNVVLSKFSGVRWFTQILSTDL